jgi:uncharacterized protein
MDQIFQLIFIAVGFRKNEKMKKLILIFLILMHACKENKIQKSYYENGKVNEEFYLVNKKFDGRYIKRDTNGSILGTGEFKSGKEHNLFKWYYPNGKFHSLVLYSYGKVINLNLWDENGVHVIKDGSGQLIEYYQNGDTMHISRYLNSKLHGKQESWYNNGQKKYIIRYDKGRLIGESIFWNINGEIREVKKYK